IVSAARSSACRSAPRRAASFSSRRSMRWRARTSRRALSPGARSTASGCSSCFRADRQASFERIVILFPDRKRRFFMPAEPRPVPSSSLGSEKASALHAALLLLLCGALYFPYLGAIPFFDKGEPREALAVQDIVQRGEWLVPLKRATDIPSKPPLFHWSAALIAEMNGALTEAAIRFPSALYATLGVLLIYGLGVKIFNRKTALLGAAILATTMVYQDQALSARVDMTLCFVVIAGLTLFYALYRGDLAHPIWFYLFYAVVGIGTLAKGPLGVLLTALVAGSLALFERRWDMIRKFVFRPPDSSGKFEPLRGRLGAQPSGVLLSALSVFPEHSVELVSAVSPLGNFPTGPANGYRTAVSDPVVSGDVRVLFDLLGQTAGLSAADLSRACAAAGRLVSRRRRRRIGPPMVLSHRRRLRRGHRRAAAGDYRRRVLESRIRLVLRSHRAAAAREGPRQCR